MRTLEEIGFLDRAVPSGSRYKPTEDGLRRKPIRFQFGSDYAPAFIAANRGAAAARGGLLPLGSAGTGPDSHRASTGSAGLETLRGPKARAKRIGLCYGPVSEKRPSSTSL